ncbi:MAG: DEAD/DEAH box helicase [Verrucomicrobiota bacterium]|nr:DEAD/DEAH box helicase [Verrucomicrobiota bacterium]
MMKKTSPSKPQIKGVFEIRAMGHPLHETSNIFRAGPGDASGKADRYSDPPLCFQGSGSPESKITGQRYRQLLEWIGSKENLTVTVAVVTPAKRYTVVREPLGEVIAHLKLVRRDDKVALELSWELENDTPGDANRLIPITCWMAFDPVERRLYFVKNGNTLNWVVDTFRKQIGYSFTPPTLCELDSAQFNAMNIRWPSEGVPCAFEPECTMRVCDLSRKVELMPSRVPSLTLKQPESYWFAFRCSENASGTKLPIAISWWEREMQIIEEINGKSLFGNSKRATVVTSLHTRILNASDDSTAEALYEAARTHPLLVQEKQASLAVSFLKKVYKARVDIRGQVLLRAASPYSSTMPAWFLTQGETVLAAEMAALVSTHCKAMVGGGTPKNDSYYVSEVEDVNAGLRGLAEACAARQIALNIDGTEHQPSSLDITLDFNVGKEIDWFELVPEVRSQGILIPAAKWEEVILKRRFNAENGDVHLLSKESLDTLESLMKQMGSDLDTGTSVVRINRLQLIDWAECKAKGLIRKLPPEVKAVFSALNKLERVPRMSLPEGLNVSLRKYQQTGYEWLAFLYTHRFGGVLADDMGLGKTVQVIAFLAGIKSGIITRIKRTQRTPAVAPRFLVVMPPTLLFNWSQEIKRFYPELTVAEHAGPDRGEVLPTADILLTSYEIARRDSELLAKTTFDVIVFDEAQQVKNLQAARAQALRTLKGNFKLCLTGTPLENHAGEYYAIVDLALPGIFGTIKNFNKALVANEGILRRVRPFVLRRTKDKIINELPPKVESDLYLELDEYQKAYYTRAVADVRSEVMQAYEDRPAAQAGIIALAALMRLRQICVSPALIDPTYTEPSPKLEHLIEKVAEVIEEGQSALVFSQFLKALDLVEAGLKALDINYLRMDGAVPVAKRKALVNAFQKATKPTIFLISLKTGGAGLNLTSASHVFHLDPWWNPAVENQATDRAHRIGQYRTVFVTRLLMLHTVEEKILILKDRKSELFTRVLAGTLDGVHGLPINREDFKFLLE